MSELNVNIVKDNLDTKNLRINILPNIEVKTYTETLSNKILKFVKKYLNPRKEKSMRKLLLELANEPIKFRSINDLGKSTHLNAIVYPTLAKLHRQGLVETKLYKDIKGTLLTYRLTERGLLHSKGILA